MVTCLVPDGGRTARSRSPILATLIPEEVRSRQHRHGASYELAPGRGSLPLRRRRVAMAAQNVSDRLITHRVPEVGQCSYNPVVAPAGILPRNSNHQALDPRPAGRASAADGSRRTWRLPVDRPVCDTQRNT